MRHPDITERLIGYTGEKSSDELKLRDILYSTSVKIMKNKKTEELSQTGQLKEMIWVAGGYTGNFCTMFATCS